MSACQGAVSLMSCISVWNCFTDS